MRNSTKKKADDSHFEAWCKDKGGRIAQLPQNHPAIEVQKNIFLKQVKALDFDILHLVKEPNYKIAFQQWKQTHCLEDDTLYEQFINKIKSYESVDPDQNDRDARRVCELYKENHDPMHFESWLACHQKEWIQALYLGKNIMQLQVRDKLYPKFIEWTKCPWQGDNYDFCIYLLQYPKGPSGYDNLTWGKTMMKCFYLGAMDKFNMVDEVHQNIFLQDKEVDLKPIQQMIKDLKNAQAKEAQAQEAQDAEEAPEAQAQEAPEAQDAEEAPEAPEAQEAQDAEEAPEAEDDLMAQLEKLKKMQADLEMKIVMQNEKKNIEKLKPKFKEMVSKVKKKRSFHNLTWNFADLPPTPKSKKFKNDINKLIKDVQDTERQVHAIREAAKKHIEIAVNTFFN